MQQNPLFNGLETNRQAPPFALVIFGVTGDLTYKKLIPSLFSLFIKGHIGRFRIFGFARRDWSADYFKSHIIEMLDTRAFSKIDERLKDEFARCCIYHQSTFEDESGYHRLADILKKYKNHLFYLSTPPSSYETIIRNMGAAGLADPDNGFARIVVEKPFGRDLQSARHLNQVLSEYFKEDQIFRIDHYLGKETVQNVMLLRFGNEIFEPVWNNRYIDHIQITVAERIGAGGRVNYYNNSGALRDMVQNHLFQLLSLVAMEPPASMSPDDVREEKVKIMKALRPIPYDKVKDYTVRGIYTEGILDGAKSPGYRQEVQENGAEGIKNSIIETFVALECHVDTWRWSGVPFYLRTGKRMSRKVSEISIHFKKPPLQLFNQADIPNTLIIRIQPEEGITLSMNAKIPGHESNARVVNMDFSYGNAFGDPTPEAYERLLLDALLGDATLYPRRDEIEASWTFITRVLKGWEKSDMEPEDYQPGSAGPAAARNLLAKNNHRWRKL